MRHRLERIALLACSAWLLVAAALHPDSLSTSRLIVDGTSAHLLLRCQVLSWVEVIDGLDADGDGAVSDIELDARRADVERYVSAHYVVRTGTARDESGGTLLEGSLLSLRRADAAEIVTPADQAGLVECEIVYASDAPIDDVLLDVTLFHTTSPEHIDLATVVWPDGARASFGLDARTPRGRSDPTGRGAFGVFFGLGWRHILGGWDHLAFVAALLLGTRSLRALFGVVTAFTLAHSITLALAALDVVTWSSPRLVEAVIALSIAYVAADNLVRPERARAPWIEAFLFGLIHGFGFAGFLRDSLVDEVAKITALFAFNVGVEAGQIAVVALLALVLAVIHRNRDGDTHLAPAWLRTAGNVAIVILGLWWFIERL